MTNRRSPGRCVGLIPENQRTETGRVARRSGDAIESAANRVPPRVGAARRRMAAGRHPAHGRRSLTGSGTPASRNPIRLLLHVPVPWVFILAYVAGIGLGFARPLPIPRWAVSAAGGVGAVLF